MEIMLVDDDPAEINVLSEIIKAKGNEFHLTIFQNGIEAFKYLFKGGSDRETIKPDFLIMKNKIPGKTGLEILTHLRLTQLFTKTVIAIISEKLNLSEKLFAQMMGVNRYYIKPNDSFGYLDMVNKLIKV